MKSQEEVGTVVFQYEQLEGLDIEEQLSQGLIDFDDLIPPSMEMVSLEELPTSEELEAMEWVEF